jgi:hypothetical protein
MSTTDRARAERLVAFLPAFSGFNSGDRPFALINQASAEHCARNPYSYCYPSYDYPEVLQQYRDLLYEDGWLDGEYHHSEGEEAFENPEIVREADLNVVTRLLRYIKAAEYWDDPTAYKRAVEGGLLPTLLTRLAELHDLL